MLFAHAYNLELNTIFKQLNHGSLDFCLCSLMFVFDKFQLNVRQLLPLVIFVFVVLGICDSIQEYSMMTTF